MLQNKKAIRSNLRRIRTSLSEAEVKQESQKINQNFLQNLLPRIYQKDSKKIFSLYFPYGNEVSTTLIAEYFRKNNILFSYPKIVEKNQPLHFVLDEKNQFFAPNSLYPNLLEPSGKVEILPDIMILPLIAFDPKLNRIGSGAGFFDRTITFLESKKAKIIRIGLAYDFQGLNSIIECEKTDQKLDFAVTSKHIFPLESINS